MPAQSKPTRSGPSEGKMTPQAKTLLPMGPSGEKCLSLLLGKFPLQRKNRVFANKWALLGPKSTWGIRTFKHKGLECHVKITPRSGDALKHSLEVSLSSDDMNGPSFNGQHVPSLLNYSCQDKTLTQLPPSSIQCSHQLNPPHRGPKLSSAGPGMDSLEPGMPAHDGSQIRAGCPSASSGGNPLSTSAFVPHDLSLWPGKQWMPMV